MGLLALEATDHAEKSTEIGMQLHPATRFCGCYGLLSSAMRIPEWFLEVYQGFISECYLQVASTMESRT